MTQDYHSKLTIKLFAGEYNNKFKINLKFEDSVNMVFCTASRQRTGYTLIYRRSLRTGRLTSHAHDGTL